MTYKEARVKLFEHLRSIGWTVITFSTFTMKTLKEPHVIIPGKTDSLWFTTQAVHMGPNRQQCRSTFIDIRAVTPEQFVKLVGGWVVQ